MSWHYRVRLRIRLVGSRVRLRVRLRPVARRGPLLMQNHRYEENKHFAWSFFKKGEPWWYICRKLRHGREDSLGKFPGRTPEAAIARAWLWCQRCGVKRYRPMQAWACFFIPPKPI